MHLWIMMLLLVHDSCVLLLGAEVGMILYDPNLLRPTSVNLLLCLFLYLQTR